MPVSPQCLVDSASDLLNLPGAAEPQFRAVVSRAYYGAFHSANSFARDVLQIDLDNIVGGKHVVLSNEIAKFSCPCPETEREIRRAGARLGIFHSLRIRADYLIGDTVTSQEAVAQIKNSRELISKLAELKSKLAA